MEPALSKMLLTSVDLRWSPQNIVPRLSDHAIRLARLTRFTAFRCSDEIMTIVAMSCTQ